MSQVPSDPELDPIESALANLVLAASRLDRDRLMFQAGKIRAKANNRSRWVWPSIAATLAVVAISESVLLAVRPGPQVIIAQQQQQPPAPARETRPAQPAAVQILTQSAPSRSEANEIWYAGGGQSLALRRQVLRFGIDGLPELPPLLSQSDAPPTESPRTLRRDQLNKLLETGGPS
jgi:hypothetical protein